jgi:hypothetical protein
VYLPVSTSLRQGTVGNEETQARVKRTDSAARRSRHGVRARPCPYAPTWSLRIVSEMMRTTFTRATSVGRDRGAIRRDGARACCP